MPLFEISALRLTIGARPLVHIASARLDRGDRAALIGPNGVGKSTLLRTIASALSPAAVIPAEPPRAGESPPHGPEEGVSISGAVSAARGATACLLSQEPPLGQAPVPRAVRAAWHLPDLPPVALSGGQRTRAALGMALASEPDVLLLDEPTNHLDLEGLERAAGALCAFRGTVLFVSHDRAFLDRVATEIWELDRPWGAEGATLAVHRGNYSAFRAQADAASRAERRAFADHERRRRDLTDAVQQQRRWTAEAFAAAGARDPHAQRLAKKAAKKGAAYERRLERLVGAAPPKPWERGRASLTVCATGFGGARLARAEDLAVGPVGPAGPVILRCARLELGPRARVALMGANGCGKTSLLRTLAGEVLPCAGRLWISPAARVAAVRQDRAGLPPEAAAEEAVRQALTAARVLQSGTPPALPREEGRAARTICARVGLRGERAGTPLAALSGGERTAVALACALIAGANLLLLDEPTNHLDLSLREAVDDALATFPGAVVVATHDRWLAEHWATEVWRVEAGRVEADTAPPPAGPPPGQGSAAGRRGTGGRAEHRRGAIHADPQSAADATAALAADLRLAELAAMLADPGRKAPRAAVEAEIEALVRARSGRSGSGAH